jgi:excisionase family DNA binding protein
MGLLRVLSKRAQEYPVKPLKLADITDQAAHTLLGMSHGLRPEDIITPEEVAARLKVPESWVYEKTRARCRNPIPCLRLGRYIRFDWNAVIKWLEPGADQQNNAKRTGFQKKR